MTRPQYLPAEVEIQAISDIAGMMLSVDTESGRHPALVGPRGEHIELPQSVCRVLIAAVEHLRRHESVCVLSPDQELSTQEAANMLSISRPYVVRLVDSGVIPGRRVGSHRRLRLEDVERYRMERDQRRRSNLHAMVREAEDQGLYDVPEVDSQLS